MAEIFVETIRECDTVKVEKVKPGLFKRSVFVKLGKSTSLRGR